MTSYPKWSEEQIAEGFRRYVSENGRLPTVIEIDNTEYLPSAKLIQRRFGGVQKFRKSLGYELTSFNKGLARKETALRINEIGRNYEMKLQDKLEEIYGEIFVHNEKALNRKIGLNSRNTINVDFFVFTLNGNFAVDVFHAKDRHSIIGSIIHKIQIYKEMTLDIYLVLYSEKVTQNDLELIVSRKHKAVQHNIKIYTYETFLQKIVSEKYPYPKLEEMYVAWKKKS